MNAKDGSPCVLVVVIALLLLVPAGERSPDASPHELRDVTVTPQPDSVTVFVKTSREAQYQADLVDPPNRLVIDFEDTSLRLAQDAAERREATRSSRSAAASTGGRRPRRVELSRTVGYAIREETNGLAIVIPTAASAAPTGDGDAAAPPPANGAATKNGAAHAGEAAAKTGAAPSDGSTQSGEAPVKNGAASASGAANRTGAGAAADAGRRRAVQIAQAPAQPPPATNGQRLISLDFKDADVVNLLRILAAESNKNVVIGEDVKGKMSITLRNVPWDLALDTVLETRGLAKVEQRRRAPDRQPASSWPRSARPRPSSRRPRSRPRPTSAPSSPRPAQGAGGHRQKLAAEQAAAELAARGPLKEETIRLSYADPEEVAKTLRGHPRHLRRRDPAPAGADRRHAGSSRPALLAAVRAARQQPPAAGRRCRASADVLAKGITIRAHKPTNSLFIRHYEDDLERIKVLIREKLDIPLPQVKIEARMEILERDDLFAIGVQWGGGGVGQASSQATLVGRGFTSSRRQHARGAGGSRPMASVYAAQPEPQRRAARSRHAAPGQRA